MTSQATGEILADERARASAILLRYPAISESDLATLKNWFERVATPLDFGLLASDPAVCEQYRAYRKDHHDRLKMRDMAIGSILLLLVIAMIGGIVLFRV